MPVYTYRCPKCGRDESAVVPIADRDHIVPFCECDPTDGAIAMERQPAAPAGKVQGGTPKFYK